MQFLRRYAAGVFSCPGPLQPAGFDPLIEENKTVAFPADGLETILPCTTEQKESILLERTHLKLFFYKSGKAVDPFAEISSAATDVYFTERGGLQHDLTALMILIRNSSLAPSDNRMSVFPALIQAETTGNVCSAWAGF